METSRKPLIGIDTLPKVMKEHARTLNGLTQEGCDELEIPYLACDPLMKVLSPRDRGIISDPQKDSLEKAGFSPGFIQGLAGNDGKRALENRIRWLTDHAVTRWWRLDYSLKERKQMINELALYGDESSKRTILPSLIQVFKEANNSDLRRTAANAL